MLEQLWSNKYKVLGLLGLVLVFWVAYMAYLEYNDQYQSCSRAGGTIIYDPKGNKIYCDKPYEPKYWLEEWLKDLIGY
jgi:hypothetical protein